MSLPIRHLPLVQKWDCQECGNCCREFFISVTAEERQRIKAQGWTDDPVTAGWPLFVGSGPPWARRYRLNQRIDGSCVFLSDENRCRLHERFGPEAKPFPCRLYPFLLIPSGSHWRVGLRYACPAAARNEGKSLEAFSAELDQYAVAFENQVGVNANEIEPPPLQKDQRLPWLDVLRFVKMLVSLLHDRGDSFERRMRKCLAVVRLCEQAKFEQVRGGRLEEFLTVVAAGLDSDVANDVAAVPRPSRVGRVLFRQTVPLYVRKDQGPERTLVTGRVGLAAAAWRFVRGKGVVPRLHAWLPETTFESVEREKGPLSPQANEVLERFYTVKVESLQFCGSAHFGFPFWAGFQALALTLPVVLWLMRAMSETPDHEAAVRAISMVDRNYGFNRVLGGRRQRIALALFNRGNDLERLIAWYSR